MVGAYALIMITCCLLAKGSRSVINLSLIPLGRLASLLTRQSFTSLQDSRRSFQFLPLQKNMHPVPISFSCPSPARRVLPRAAICTLYLDSSIGTKAVLLIRLSAAALSVSVRTFHASNLRAVYPAVFPIFPLFQQLGGISVSRGMLTRVV